jgi:hypothetical protein
MGYASAFVYYSVLEIRLGKLTKIKEFEYEGYVKFKDGQFELFKTTKEYQEVLATLKEKFRSTDEQLEMFMRIHDTEYITYFLNE